MQTVVHWKSINGYQVINWQLSKGQQIWLYLKLWIGYNTMGGLTRGGGGGGGGGVLCDPSNKVFNPTKISLHPSYFVWKALTQMSNPCRSSLSGAACSPPELKYSKWIDLAMVCKSSHYLICDDFVFTFSVVPDDDLTKVCLHWSCAYVMLI
jgi:hypothetical protein